MLKGSAVVISPWCQPSRFPPRSLGHPSAPHDTRKKQLLHSPNTRVQNIHTLDHHPPTATVRTVRTDTTQYQVGTNCRFFHVVVARWDCSHAVLLLYYTSLHASCVLRACFVLPVSCVSLEVLVVLGVVLACCVVSRGCGVGHRWSCACVTQCVLRFMRVQHTHNAAHNTKIASRFACSLSCAFMSCYMSGCFPSLLLCVLRRGSVIACRVFCACLSFFMSGCCVSLVFCMFRGVVVLVVGLCRVSRRSNPSRVSFDSMGVMFQGPIPLQSISSPTRSSFSLGT